MKQSGFTLTEGAIHADRFKYLCKSAFTLAEVLITLGIVGVVAAMTLPALIEKHQKLVFVTEIKYAYTIIANAFLASKAENGDPTGWDWGSDFSNTNIERIVKTYLSPYLNKAEEGLTGANNVYYIRLKNGLTLTFELDGCSDTVNCKPVYVNTLYILASSKGKTGASYQAGRDYSREDFILRFDKSNKGLIFFHGGSGFTAKTREDAINHSQFGCNKNIPRKQRYNCAQLIFLDGWQIKDDYPW